MVAKSGLQKEVLALYRTLLREACKKDRSMMTTTTTTTTTITTPKASFSSFLQDENDDNNITSTAHVRSEFRRQAAKVSRKDFRTIEYKIRHGYKQIKLLQMPGVVTFRSWS